MKNLKLGLLSFLLIFHKIVSIKVVYYKYAATGTSKKISQVAHCLHSYFSNSRKWLQVRPAGRNFQTPVLIVYYI